MANEANKERGTYLYYAPEILNPPYSYQVDIFSLGLSLFAKIFQCHLYELLFYDGIEEEDLKAELREFNKEKDNQQQNEINEAISAIFKNELPLNCEKTIIAYQEQISKDHEQAYKYKNSDNEDFDVYDLIFMLIAMLQVIYISIVRSKKRDKHTPAGMTCHYGYCRRS